MPAEDFPLISDLLNDASAGNEVSSANATNGVALDGSASSNAPGLNGHVQREESPRKFSYSFLNLTARLIFISHGS